MNLKIGQQKLWGLRNRNKKEEKQREPKEPVAHLQADQHMHHRSYRKRKRISEEIINHG